MNMIIKVTDFQKQYHNHLVKVEDISITKRVNLLVGKNGSGKSTILKAIANLIKYDGEILCDKQICFMSEIVSYPIDLDLETFIKHLNNISLSEIDNDEVDTLLENFDLIDKLKENLYNLSKGMKAKVNIVQCLMEHSDLYLLDEPLSGLDEAGVKCLIQYIKKSDKQFIISTHLAGDFSDISDEVFEL